jgi:hypothetical protein
VQYKRFFDQFGNGRVARHQIARILPPHDLSGDGSLQPTAPGSSSVNRNRIETFKRTRQYTRTGYDLLVRVLAKFEPLYTVAHVLAEVSNLTDLPRAERLGARLLLKNTISLLNEVGMPSARAAEDRLYQKLGLVDSDWGRGKLSQLHGAN